MFNKQKLGFVLEILSQIIRVVMVITSKVFFAMANLSVRP